MSIDSAGFLDQISFLSQLLKQLESGDVQQAANDVHHRLLDLGYFTPEVKVATDGRRI